MKKELLFDVYNTHTKNCAVCMEALKNLKISRNVFFGLSFVSIGVSVGGSGASVPQIRGSISFIRFRSLCISQIYIVYWN